MGTSGKGWFSHQTWSRLYRSSESKAVNIFIHGVSDPLCLLLGCNSSVRPTSLVHQEFQKAYITVPYLQESLQGFRRVNKLLPILEKKKKTTQKKPNKKNPTKPPPTPNQNQWNKTQPKPKRNPQNTKTNQWTHPSENPTTIYIVGIGGEKVLEILFHYL